MVGVDAVREEMQKAFAGTITFAEAHNTFAGWNAYESEGGCPLSGNIGFKDRWP